jgi:hypothetical protein
VTAETFFARVIAALERAQVPYMVTGSFASSAHGQVRGTRDIDVVIAPTPEQLRAFVAEFPSDRYYAEEFDALDALQHDSQFNIIDFGSSWKVDLIMRRDHAAGVIATQGPSLDRSYVERWVRELGLEHQWRKALERAG